jgi:hypothetical protein
MTTLSIDKLKAGLKLADDAVAPQGQLIAKKGDEITEKHLKAFKAWGVIEVNVCGSESTESDMPAEKPIESLSKQEIVREIDHLFKKTNQDHPVIAELYQLVLERQHVS